MALKYAIHPAIGVARVGDSPAAFFLGPEAPGLPLGLSSRGEPRRPGDPYRDPQGRIMRQGARFRIYEYASDGAEPPVATREITAAEARIEWRVHLANRKAAAPEFDGTRAGGRRRNSGVADADRLVVDAGVQRIGGVDQPMQRLAGSFQGSAARPLEVPLGDLLTDAAGRLIVLGGFGRSQSVSAEPVDRANLDFANNDDWCDDVSDGPVQATVHLNGRAESIEADPAWAIVTPPDFAPAIANVVTLYDVVYDVMARFDPSLAVGDGARVSFTEHVYPILRAVSNLHWVSREAARMHGPGQPQHFLSPSQIERLASAAAEQELRRARVFRALRDPRGGGTGSMPKLPARPPGRDGEVPIFSLTRVQYERMRRWASGAFEPDWPGHEPAPTPLDGLPLPDRPRALDRAALEGCVGGGFFPGIEVGQVMLEESTYDRRRPFRVAARRPAGALTARMAVPWQADFALCNFAVDQENDDEDAFDWWPGQRPNDVQRDGERQAWAPEDWGAREMLADWSKLGFVVADPTTGECVERERTLAQDR